MFTSFIVLDDRSIFVSFTISHNFVFLFSEITRLQEDSAGLDLPHFIDDAPQL